jgi:hypothetical protein
VVPYDNKLNISQIGHQVLTRNAHLVTNCINNQLHIHIYQ